MSASVQIPLWVAIGTPVLSFAGSYGGQLVARKGAKELETRSKREEALRVLRWAAELAVSDDERKVQLGVAELEALIESDLLDMKELQFVDAALFVVYEAPVDEIDEIERTGEDVDVEVVSSDHDDYVDEDPAVSWGYADGSEDGS